MRTIHKYPIYVDDNQVIAIPAGGQLLCVQTQGVDPCIWVLVDNEEVEREYVKVKTFGTGHRIEGYCGEYLGTYQLADGALVFHVFTQTFGSLEDTHDA